MENELEKIIEKLGDIIQENYRSLSHEQIEAYNNAVNSIQDIIDMIEE